MSREKLHIPDEIDLTAFISKEAHDLKSPFNRALGFLKLVLKGMDGPISDQAKGDLTITYQNTLYTLGMMSSLIDMARLGRGERTPNPAPYPLNPIIQQTIIEWKRQYPKENTVTINTTTPDVSVLADEMMLRQALGKWISYVAEFVQEAVTVNVLAEELVDQVQFTIRSQGKKALPPPECDLTMHGYIARQIILLHNGEVQCVEDEEDGAFVQFTLPKG